MTRQRQLDVRTILALTERADAAERRALTLESGRLTLMARAQAAEAERDRLTEASSEMGAKLEARALACRIAGTVFYELPQLAQYALYGIAAELDEAAVAVAARDRLAEALNALDLAAGYYRRELKEILAHCEDDDQSLAISKIRAHAQDAIRAADASLAAAGSGGNTEEEAGLV